MSVSLENFNQRAQPPMVLDSPRSIKACRAEGIDPNDMSIVDIVTFGKNLDAEIDND